MAQKKDQARRIDELTSLADERADELRRLALELTRVQQQERECVAKLLHDDLQQLLAAAKMRLSMARARTPEDLRGLLDGVDDLLAQSIESCRTLTAELSPAVLRESSPAEILAWLARWMNDKHGLAVSLKADSAGDPVHDALRILVFEAARELLFNVTKHAGVKEASVSLARAEGERLRLVVADAGHGFDPGTRDPSSFGLSALRHRLRLLGGTLEIDSAPHQGTRVTVEIPLR